MIFDNTESFRIWGTVEAHAVVRSVANIAAGTHTVTIQRNVSAGRSPSCSTASLQVQALKE